MRKLAAALALSLLTAPAFARARTSRKGPHAPRLLRLSARGARTRRLLSSVLSLPEPQRRRPDQAGGVAEGIRHPRACRAAGSARLGGAPGVDHAARAHRRRLASHLRID